MCGCQIDVVHKTALIINDTLPIMHEYYCMQSRRNKLCKRSNDGKMINIKLSKNIPGAPTTCSAVELVTVPVSLLLQ